MQKNEELLGIGVGVAENAKTYADNVIMNAARGHGFAAEKANHLKDVLLGKDAKIVGGDNVKNGPDRIVNEISIQSKYCSSGSKCIQECFDEGQFRYWNPDGSPMPIEVPADLYDAAVQSMENRIQKGQVKGISDPQQAKTLIRKGAFTYQQARNIARFGTVESITYDAVNGIRIAVTTMGLSAAISFAYSIWSGKDLKVAVDQACFTGFKVGGVTWASSILMAQIGRTGVEQSLRPLTDYAVKNMGSQTAAWIANGLRGSSSSIYGAAAMSNVSKLLRGNLVTGAVTTVVLSSGDIARLISGRISGGQMLKNTTTTAAGVAGGAGGYAIGAGIGTMLLPGFGTVVGGLIGGYLAGSAVSSASKTVLDVLIEDDAKAMLNIVEAELSKLAFDYLLSEAELKAILDQLQAIDLAKKLRDIYVSSDRPAKATELLEPFVVEIVKQRPRIMLPTSNQLMDGYEKMYETILEEEIAEDILMTN